MLFISIVLVGKVIHEINECVDSDVSNRYIQIDSTASSWAVAFDFNNILLFSLIKEFLSQFLFLQVENNRNSWSLIWHNRILKETMRVINALIQFIWSSLGVFIPKINTSSLLDVSEHQTIHINWHHRLCFNIQSSLQLLKVAKRWCYGHLPRN